VQPRKPVWLGTLELVAVLVVVIAILVLAVWFVFFARDPLLRP
jgi:hypothetical protein